VQKGTLLFWTISDLTTTADKLRALGFGHYLPRNEYKTAMIKALHKYVKGNVKLYRRFDDFPKDVKFGVFVQTTGGGTIDMNREVVITVNKTTGLASFNSQVPFDETPILTEFELAKKTLDSDQFRTLVTEFVKNNHGVPMKPSGGLYFIDKRFNGAIEELQNLFDTYPEAILYKMEVGSDEDSLTAIEDATAAQLFKQAEDLALEVTEAFAKGTITRKQLENRQADALKILGEVRIHEQNLRSQAESLKEKITRIDEVVSKALHSVETGLDDSEGFTSMLRLL
jgi:hypothetical protein